VETITCESNVSLNSDLRLDDEYQYTVTGNATVEVNNFGTHKIKPVIEVTGSFTTISITMDGKTLGYAEALANGTVVIDNAKMQVAKDSINKNSVTTGDFLSLTAGVNSVQISGTGLNCTVSFKFKPMYY
jgi:phage-related protein